MMLSHSKTIRSVGEAHEMLDAMFSSVGAALPEGWERAEISISIAATQKTKPLTAEPVPRDEDVSTWAGFFNRVSRNVGSGVAAGTKGFNKLVAQHFAKGYSPDKSIRLIRQGRTR